MRVIVTVVACAAGVMKLHGANVSGLSAQEQSKWWLLSGSVSSFYDDNTFNRPDISVPQEIRIFRPGTTNYVSRTNRVNLREGSLGIQVRPGVAINLPLTRTLLRASYDYTLDFYENRPDQKIEQEHLFDFGLNHKFSPRYDIDFTDTFSISDRPAVLGENEAATVFGRADASNIRNRAKLEFSALMSPTFGVLAGYGHDLTDYDSLGYSQTLDNTENSAHVDARWFASQNTMLFTGYRVGLVDYFGPPTFIGFKTNTNPRLDPIVPVFQGPEIKNVLVHTVYFGAQQDISRQLAVQGRIGVSYADFFNRNESSISPYVDGVATYTYRRDSTIQLGANIDRYPTDTGIGEEDRVTLDVLALYVFLGVNHRFTARITGNARVGYQKLVYNGGDNDGKTDDVYSLSLGGDYKIREYLWLTASYSYSMLESGRPGGEFISYDKNYVSVGVRATF